ncbi:hypothetical protein CA54_27290 [Symmachiella macrocystis]|uniref:Probable inorganic carbon transporter subunit DabA n=1 Tax=Symmachiella macrocystis TaxID=2527985 RepID=A0A5C6BPA3_9PLAN|nr:DUF2309 domain-containing protein [Symmachiella macrocystis]TWU13888.1 hypothetical protein CA54_27290 [Symmachiella macrocystis]
MSMIQHATTPALDFEIESTSERPQDASLKFAATGLEPQARDTWIESNTGARHLKHAIQNVSAKIAPVWPLKDYVAVNPFLGLADQPFLKARKILRTISNCETLMSLSYYQTKFQNGELNVPEIEAAVAQINEGFDLPHILVEEVLQQLKTVQDDSESDVTLNPERRFRSVAEIAGRYGTQDWPSMILEEISKHCAAHYDEGQATWMSPWKKLPLFQAWHEAAQQDLRFSLLGAAGFRKFVGALPHLPEAAIAILLQKLSVPQDLWEPFLHCQAQTIPGWSAWTKYKIEAAKKCGRDTHDFTDLMAIRLAYDVAVAEATDIQIDWSSYYGIASSPNTSAQTTADQEVIIRFALLRASEIAYQRKLVGALSSQSLTSNYDEAARTLSDPQCLAQMVFCIDVRSERYRRHLEQSSKAVQTFGFAGFFGVPMAYEALGDTTQTPQVPALLSPNLVIHEHLRDTNKHETTAAADRKRFRRLIRKSWKQFQTSAASCFGFVETSGLFYAWQLLRKSAGAKGKNSRFDGVRSRDKAKLGPDLSNLNQQGLPAAKQIELAESILRGIGLTHNFAKLVVFCGHGSTTQNNPLQAGLECGACCGHSGEPNARFAAALLNQPHVRTGLKERGIAVPDDTCFLAAQHDTTSDSVSYFDTDLLLETRQIDLQELAAHTSDATAKCQLERMPNLKAANIHDVLKRTEDWSEVRPEWGLAGNAAFIATPRSVTQGANLEGRAFLHSYDFRDDPGFGILEQIMTAPMVVAHWINMQYFASSVDNQHFGSGSKTIHNVVGQFGVFSGNGGDLTTGLPWQSLHDGDELHHEPLRLLSVIAAPRNAVAEVIQSNQVVEDLLINGWLNLIVIEHGEFYRHTTNQKWQKVETDLHELQITM